MIVTASPFFNELDLLEVKFHELAGEVDAHIIVEAPLTFTGLPKPLYFQEHADRFKKWNVIHSACELPAQAGSPWEREWMQYQAVIAAVKKLNPAIVLWVDADEIPRAGTVKRFVESGCKTVTLEMDMLLFFFNRIDCTQKWTNGKIGWFDPGDEIQPWRGMTGLPILKDAGWHCEYFGSHGDLMAKLRATSHAEEPGAINMRSEILAGALPGIERTAHYPIERCPKLVRCPYLNL